MDYKDKVVIVTGGAQGIGKCIAEEFRKQGALVEVIDKQEGLDHFVGDLSNRYAIEEFTKLVIEKYGKVDYIINNALPLMKGLDECTWEEFQYALAVGITAPFYLVKLLVPYLAEGASIVNKESRIPSPIQISIIASVLRRNVPNTPILSVEQPQN